MKRLTVHLNRVEKKTEVIEGRSKSRITNTLSFNVKTSEDVNAIITNINETYVPRNNVKSWYLSNIT
jgi:hypothetical protein